jgi:hypothetical protein
VKDYVVGAALFELERGHLERLLCWAIASAIGGLAALALAPRTRQPAFWRHLGIQCVAWGAVDAAIVALAWRGHVPREVGGAIALDRVLWLNIGLDVGYAMVGATLVILAWQAPRRPGLAGAGAAVVVQGLVLAALDAYLSARIVH